MYNDIFTINEYLIDGVLKQDVDAQKRFVELSERYIYGALHSFDNLTNEDIEELFQTVFFKLFDDNQRRIKLWNHESLFTTYLYRIVVNIVKDYLGSAHFRRTKMKLKPRSDDNNVIDDLFVESDSSPQPDLLALSDSLTQLKENERQIIKLYYFKGLKEREIAERLNKPINTISSLKNRTLKKLKVLMEEK